MTYKQPDGLDPRRYKNRVSAPVSRSYMRRSAGRELPAREQRTPLAQLRAGRRTPLKKAVALDIRVPSGTRNVSERGLKERTRVVTMPHEAVQPLTWAERHARYRAQGTGQFEQKQLTPHTLAQTGHPSRAGQVHIRQQLPRQRANSRVPSRSGKSRNPGMWRRFLGLFSVLAIVAGGIGFALFSPTFRVQQVDVSGTHNTKLIASIQHIGIKGQDIFLLDQANLVKLLESLPPVAFASLEIQLPGTIQVAIEERLPVLLWQTGKQTFGLAQDGTVIAPQADLSGTEHLALVVDTRRSAASQIHPGSNLNAVEIVFVEQVFEQATGMEGVTPFSLQYVDSLTEDGHAVPANQAGYGSYVIISANGWRAYLGDAQNSISLADRLRELQQILNAARQQGLRLATIDLRFGSRPTYTLKS
ncbi:MAG TPA: FtsQ-type POTRA domain-containing protein [Ktedonobacteraceae bacterium]